MALYIKMEYESAPVLNVCRFLLDEIESENEYNRNYATEKSKAKAVAKNKNDNSCWAWRSYMPKEFDHEPRQSVINDDLKMLRRLCLKIQKGVL